MEINKITHYVLKINEDEAKKLFDFIDNYLEGEDKRNSEREYKVLRKIYNLIGNQYL